MPPDPASGVALRPVVDTDLDVFFRYMQDPGAVKMAAFTAEDPADRVAFDAHWTHIRSSPSVMMRTVTVYGEVAGNIGTYVDDGHREVTFWIGRPFWGSGIATQALRLLLEDEPHRPLRARAASKNLRSIGVLTTNGFVVTGTAMAYAAGVGAEVEETIMELPA